jgi:two-component system, chemotaxis family, CheB/CheR fusion protein
MDLDAVHSELQGDFLRLQQVFWNLLKNASKFTGDGGQIRVASRNEGPNAIVLEVTDTGRGIDAAALPEIFEPFRQGDEGVAREFGGLGLGLAIAKAIVLAHGGCIDASSPGRNRGSTFLVTLPVSGPDPAAA